MNLGEDAGGVVTVCACAGNSDFERIRETLSGNVCAEQRARDAANEVARAAASPAVRVKAVLGGIGVEEFALKEDEFVESMAEAAGVEEARVMILSVMETNSRRHGRGLLAQGVLVVSEIETQTPQALQGSFSQETLGERLQARGLPLPSRLEMTAMAPTEQQSAAGGTGGGSTASPASTAPASASASPVAGDSEMSATAAAAGICTGAGVLVLGVAALFYLRPKSAGAGDGGTHAGPGRNLEPVVVSAGVRADVVELQSGMA